MKHNSSPFEWRHFGPTIILLCVRRYCRYPLSYRDVAEMTRERGLDVDHSTVFRRVQRYAAETNKRMRPHLNYECTSYNVDETYIKVGKSCKYLCRAVGKRGTTIESMPSAERDISAAKRFFKKLMRAEHRRLPFLAGLIRFMYWFSTQPPKPPSQTSPATQEIIQPGVANLNPGHAPRGARAAWAVESARPARP